MSIQRNSWGGGLVLDRFLLKWCHTCFAFWPQCNTKLCNGNKSFWISSRFSVWIKFRVKSSLNLQPSIVAPWGREHDGKGSDEFPYHPDKIFFSVWSNCLILTSVFYWREKQLRYERKRCQMRKKEGKQQETKMEEEWTHPPTYADKT